MNKLNVGIFIDTYYPMIDGVITVVDNLAINLSKNFNVIVFTTKSVKRKKCDIKRPYQIIKSKSIPIFFLDYDLPTPIFDRNFKKALKESKLDIVYFHSPMPIAKAGIKYAKKHNIPIISHLHSQFKRDFYRATHSKILTNILLKKIIKTFNQSDCCIAVNKFTQNLFVNEYKLKAPTVVIPSATDLAPINDKNIVHKINDMFNLKSNDKILTFVGRLNKLKNIDLIIDSVKILKEKLNDVKCLLVGAGKDEPYFRKKIQKSNLGEFFIFTGKITDKEILKGIYKRSHLLLFPSFYDTDGLIKFEAAAQKTPCVCIEGTGVASSIIDNITGYISKNSSQEFALKIYNALRDKTKYEEICSNAYNKLYRTWDESANEVNKLIIKLINKKKEKINDKQK